MQIDLQFLQDEYACIYGKRLFIRAYPKGNVRLTRKNMILFVRKLARRIGYVDAADSLSWLVDLDVFEKEISDKAQNNFWRDHERFAKKRGKGGITDRKYATGVINAVADTLSLK